MKIVCIGNSIVNGFPHRRSQCFVSLWRQSSGHEIINKGENGDTTPNVFARFEKDVISHKPSVVVVFTGTNDFIYDICTPEVVLNHLDQMVSLARKNAITTILVTPLLVDVPMAENCWIPDINYTLVNKKLAVLRNLMMDYGKRNDVKIIDAQERFYHLYTEENKRDFLHDGLHPTVLGHEAISKFLQD